MPLSFKKKLSITVEAQKFYNYQSKVVNSR